MNSPKDAMCLTREEAQDYIDEFFIMHPKSKKKFTIEKREVYFVKEEGKELRWDLDKDRFNR